MASRPPIEGHALVVAAGRGARFGGDAPKQYAPLAGRPVIRHGLEVLAGHPSIRAVRVVIHPDDGPAYADAVQGLGLLEPVTGGATRQESVRLGLESLVPLAPEVVLIHDAARPLLRRALVDRVLEALATAPAALPVLPVTDSLKRLSGGRIVGTVAREGLVRAQTPQGFRFRAILEAHRRHADTPATDDAALAGREGLEVALVAGEEDNLKITTAGDLARAEALLRAGLVPRVGQGFDVHRFGAGDHVVLGGVRIPFERGLVGHSDADVALHALTDALLGTIGAGDIGTHFPPSEARWRGADSALFLAHARDLVVARGGRIAHVDLTVVCERPRIGPHREAIVARIGELLGLAAGGVGLKATTSEGLGFTGRGEGIAALALATVLLPA
jgi:2-C-methyl-D-erythritol 4-phosphate cytidylyltransferase / 2-C-methyl-D-erythritol 2,4-cyclodiphosphate synthase